jgi:hypothetical protein
VLRDPREPDEYCYVAAVRSLVDAAVRVRRSRKSVAPRLSKRTIGRMSQKSDSSLRFGPDFVAEYRRRVGRRPPEQRQLTYEIAVSDEFAPWRQWLDEQLALLPAAAADVMARRIWLDEHFWPVNFELATGAGLRAAGFAAVYEQEWSGLTPDWTVLSDLGQPCAFVEVHTDQPPSEAFGRMRTKTGASCICGMPRPTLEVTGRTTGIRAIVVS